jgi:ribosomal-protein-alanine N-acetyltransferase
MNRMIRCARPADIPSMDAVNRECMDENYPFSVYYNAVLNKRAAQFVVYGTEKDEDFGKVIGYILSTDITRLSETFPYGSVPRNQEYIVHITSVAVMPKHRNKGLGRALVEHVVGAVSGVPVSLHVRKSNLIAQKIYEKVGFVVKNTVANYYTDGEDAYFMLRIASEPDPVIQDVDEVTKTMKASEISS